jgi:hypothetical protein
MARAHRKQPRRVSLANCYFAHNSSGFPALLPCFDAPSGGSFHPFPCYPGRVTRTWRRPFPSCGVTSPQAPTPDRASLPATIAQSALVDLILAGLLALLVRPTRLLRSAIVLKPSTLLALHKAMSERKYRMLFSPKRRRKPGRKGPSAELIQVVVEMKQRSPTWGCPRIAQQWPWRSTFKSTKTWFAGFLPITTCRDRTPMAPPG